VAQADGAALHAACPARPSELRKPTTAAILLAAGRSSRMGAFKPLLPFGSKTVIECCVDYLREGGVEEIIIVLGHRADEIRRKVSGVSFAINPDPDSEMGASIAVGVRELPETAQVTLIALVDHPAVPATVVSTLLESWKSGARLVIPTFHDRGGHPVLVDLSFKPELSNLPASGGLRALFDAHRNDVKRIPVDSPFIARDMDTWDDYATLHMEVIGRPAPETPRD
jgi:molybdenum cofactor cytidylyltransferase